MKATIILDNKEVSVTASLRPIGRGVYRCEVEVGGTTIAATTTDSELSDRYKELSSQPWGNATEEAQREVVADIVGVIEIAKGEELSEAVARL